MYIHPLLLQVRQEIRRYQTHFDRIINSCVTTEQTAGLDFYRQQLVHQLYHYINRHMPDRPTFFGLRYIELTRKMIDQFNTDTYNKLKLVLQLN